MTDLIGVQHFRHALAAASIALLLYPASAAHAGIDSVDAVQTLATDAVELLAEERALIHLSDGASAEPVAETAADQARLAAVDGQGHDLLLQFDELGVELTEAIRETLDRLPLAAASDEQARLAPRDVVYLAAIEDLLRIAATPASVAPSTEASAGRSFGLLAVAAVSLFLLGLAALANTLRRRPDDGELAAMAWSDSLTGLANRRRLDRDLASHRRGRGPTAVIMVDVDHFKAVNDTFGHQLGDDILRQVGVMLAHLVRFDDVVYRCGGAEFCILLPDACAEDARVIADRIVEAAREIRLPDGGNLTVSVGFADATFGDVSDAVACADRALNAAKDKGRDRAETDAGGREFEPA